jgi:molybdopterin synthase catalytic subunit
MISLTQERIDVEAVVASVVTDASGGVNVFLGTTRNHSEGKAVRSLEYEAYPEMAKKEIAKIVTEVHYHWPAHKISVVHRLGLVPLGEVSVAIAVSASHRKESFEACQYIIDRLKERVPIWKKEEFEDGTSAWSQASHGTSGA